MGSLGATIGAATSVDRVVMEEDKITESLPEKSKSLRKTSLKKRLQTEIKKANPKAKEKVANKRKLSKYRRKTANAKERERMKKMNDVFATLKSVIPVDNKEDQEEEKETKVTTLRSAIHYINYLKQLIEDCDAGLVDKTEFTEKEEKVNFEDLDKNNSRGRKKKVTIQTNQKSQKPNTQKKTLKRAKQLVKSTKPITLDTKWTNYSQQFLGYKFSTSKNQCVLENKDTFKIETFCKNYVVHPLPDITIFNQTNQRQEYCFSPSESSCSSPTDVNEVSLHISLLDDQDTFTSLQQQEQIFFM